MSQQDLRTASLAYILKIYQNLPPVSEDHRNGFYRATFIGPAWLRATAGPSLAISGLKGWQGKRFITPNSATNILKSKEKLTEKLTMSCEEGPSDVDGKIGRAHV